MASLSSRVADAIRDSAYPEDSAKLVQEVDKLEVALLKAHNEFCCAPAWEVYPTGGRILVGGCNELYVLLGGFNG